MESAWDALCGERKGGAGTYVGAHGRDEGDGSATSRDHVACSLPSSEERAVHVNVVETLYTVERVAAWFRSLERKVTRSASARKTGDVMDGRTRKQSSSQRYLYARRRVSETVLDRKQ